MSQQPEKHTPGPWHTERVNGQIWIDSEFGAVAKACGGYHEDDETIPNADLIAAAPDLLAALKTLVDAYEDPQLDDPHALVLIAKAAIEKAEGVTHV